MNNKSNKRSNSGSKNDKKIEQPATSDYYYKKDSNSYPGKPSPRISAKPTDPITSRSIKPSRK